MSKKNHRPGIREGFLVKRKLKLEGVPHEQVEGLVSEVDSLPGVDRASIDEERHVLRVAYDASRTSLKEVAAVLSRHQAELSHSWWARFKESWYHQQDVNVRDNSRHEPQCCNKPPV